MRSASHGFTVSELMISVVLLAVFMQSIASIGLHTRSEHRTLAGYHADLHQVRALLDDVEREVRRARRARVESGALVLSGPTGEVTYSLRGSELVRSAGDERLLAQCLARFDAGVDGVAVRVTMQLRPRIKRADGAPVRFATTVCMRGCEGSR